MSEIFQNREQKRREIFKESTQESEPDQSSHLSLRSYLSKRIYENIPLTGDAPAELSMQSVQGPPGLMPEQEVQTPDEKAINGNQLNSLDSQLSAGLEQYLPTPAIRLRIIKDRLSKEITRLNDQLANYHTLKNPPPDVSRKIEGLQNKLASLRVHEKQIDEDLARLFTTKASLVFQISRAWMTLRESLGNQIQNLSAKLSPDGLMQKLNPDRFRIISLNRQLTSISDVLKEQMASTNRSSVEVGTLINQYDQTISEIEQLADILRNRKSWREKASEAIVKSVRKLYS